MIKIVLDINFHSLTIWKTVQVKQNTTLLLQHKKLKYHSSRIRILTEPVEILFCQSLNVDHSANNSDSSETRN